MPSTQTFNPKPSGPSPKPKPKREILQATVKSLMRTLPPKAERERWSGGGWTASIDQPGWTPSWEGRLLQSEVSGLGLGGVDLGFQVQGFMSRIRERFGMRIPLCSRKKAKARTIYRACKPLKGPSCKLISTEPLNSAKSWPLRLRLRSAGFSRSDFGVKGFQGLGVGVGFVLC